MSTLGDIFDAITTALQTDWPELNVRTGAKYLANNEDALPRVVYIPPRPGEETFEAPDFVGQATGRRPKAFRTRVAPCEIHIAAETFDDTERLAHDMASAIHRLTYGAYVLIGGGYLSENESAWAQYGEVYVLRVAFRQPILERPMGRDETTVNIGAGQIQGETQFPDGTTEIEPDYPP